MSPSIATRLLFQMETAGINVRILSLEFRLLLRVARRLRNGSTQPHLRFLRPELLGMLREMSRVPRGCGRSIPDWESVLRYPSAFIFNFERRCSTCSIIRNIRLHKRTFHRDQEFSDRSSQQWTPDRWEPALLARCNFCCELSFRESDKSFSPRTPFLEMGTESLCLQC